MKKNDLIRFYALITVLSLLSLSFLPANKFYGDLVVEIKAARSSKGEIVLTLFNKKDGFPNEVAKAFKTLRTKSNKGSCTAVFENVQAGTYALSAYHDENGDGKFNETWYGKPVEGVAVSNDAKGRITGPPSFEEAKFSFGSSATTTILKMKYF